MANQPLEKYERTGGNQTVFVNEFTNGILDPGKPMLGPVADGGHIVANTAPGCWGPMITPELRGGHEVTVPVAVAGAETGDAIAIRIRDITVTSLATASGNDVFMDGRYNGDPYVARRCPGCGTPNPKTKIEGIGQTAVRCIECGADATPFNFTHGYTIAFDPDYQVGITLDQAAAEQIARDAKRYAALPDKSIQNSILTFAPHDLVGLITRLRPFLGQLGTAPAVPMPDSHNAGDFGSFLIGAPHEYALTAEQLEKRTDGHLDISAVRTGAILVCPVKVPGGGVYLGDMHALQGDGEIAGHTCDVSGTVTLQVNLLKGLELDGPILFPVLEDLPFLARPLSLEEKARAEKLARHYGLATLEESLPISVIGSGPNLNEATENGLERAARLLEMSVPEVKNRATIAGAIQIGRHPGIVQVILRSPVDRLEKLGLLPLAMEQYGSPL
ncbi:Acetamidase/formamidase [Desulfacinum hydrothermale DSM 13146]|uniref:Acetamidase/formamidase n=1 Tax=Desulfacinum hydrothermale DSM 13146 TaxID=1121390 RepID=A0A1W1XVF4_9BACT|nr:acetamidase/formamidase family protein [Desulfacinum hydrothermale]SMC27824.1 Acetamidase/formamidase [Desulfacinum hydrothermale DSM 13146]